MSSFSEATKQRVRQRAGNRCEYCQSHQDYLMGWLQINHFWPVSKGGNTDALRSIDCSGFETE
jgi:hypothetical protein